MEPFLFHIIFNVQGKKWKQEPPLLFFTNNIKFFLLESKRCEVGRELFHHKAFLGKFHKFLLSLDFREPF